MGGRFYSTPADNMDALEDPRYMVNIISSAITNKPPPKAVANLLARRNKVHHLRDGNTDGISSEGPCKGGLNVSIRVEIDNHDREGKTEGYGMSIPKLALASKDQAGTVGHPQLHNTTAAPENMTQRH